MMDPFHDKTDFGYLGCYITFSSFAMIQGKTIFSKCYIFRILYLHTLAKERVIGYKFYMHMQFLYEAMFWVHRNEGIIGK